MRITAREARARMAELLTAVERGEAVEITRHGRVVAQVTAPATEGNRQERRAARQHLRERLPAATTPAIDIVRDLREER